MNSTRNDIIRKILDAYDTIERLEIANSTLRERVRAYEAGGTEEVRTLADMDEKVMAVGRAELVKKALDYWHHVHLDEDEDTGEVSAEGFARWRKRVVKADKVPSWCSLDDFYDYFAVELREVYDAECEKAVAEAHNERG